MTRHALRVLALVLLPSALHAQIEWHTDLKRGLALARELRKPVLVDVRAEWCPPCKAMDESVFPRPEVVAALDGFVCVQLDVDRTRTRPDWYSGALPTLAVLDPWGNYLGQRRGYVAADVLVSLMKTVPRDYAPVAEALSTLQADRDDGLALAAAGEFYLGAGLFPVALEYFKRAVRSQAAKRDVDVRARALFGLGETALRLPDPKAALAAFERGVKECGPQHRPMMLVGLGTAHYRRGKPVEARRAYEEVCREFPGSDAAALARANLARLDAPAKP